MIQYFNDHGITHVLHPEPEPGEPWRGLWRQGILRIIYRDNFAVVMKYDPSKRQADWLEPAPFEFGDRTPDAGSSELIARIRDEINRLDKVPKSSPRLLRMSSFLKNMRRLEEYDLYKLDASQRTFLAASYEALGILYMAFNKKVATGFFYKSHCLDRLSPSPVLKLAEIFGPKYPEMAGYYRAIYSQLTGGNRPAPIHRVRPVSSRKQ
jgi:hypothetical protein